VDFVEICNVFVRKMIIKAAKRIFNSDKICRSYSDLNFGVTFLEHSVVERGVDCHVKHLHRIWFHLRYDLDAFKNLSVDDLAHSTVLC